jgi:hypothetical protein
VGQDDIARQALANGQFQLPVQFDFLKAADELLPQFERCPQARFGGAAVVFFDFVTDVLTLTIGLLLSETPLTATSSTFSTWGGHRQ